LIYDPVIPVPWILCIALALLGSAAFYQYRSARRLGAGRNGVLLLSRLAALAIIILLLFQPSRDEKVPVPAREKSVIFAVDDSASMREPHRRVPAGSMPPARILRRRASCTRPAAGTASSPLGIRETRDSGIAASRPGGWSDDPARQIDRVPAPAANPAAARRLVFANRRA
jgi:hypothetical protein